VEVRDPDHCDLEPSGCLKVTVYTGPEKHEDLGGLQPDPVCLMEAPGGSWEAKGCLSVMHRQHREGGGPGPSRQVSLFRLVFLPPALSPAARTAAQEWLSIDSDTKAITAYDCKQKVYVDSGAKLNKLRQEIGELLGKLLSGKISRQ